jgi:hypothetical protein
MDVITARNLNVPKPSAEWTEKLKAALAAFAHPGDPLVAGLWADDWPGRHSVHCLYSVGLRTVMGLTEAGMDQLKPCSWRFIAGGHKSMPTASGCWATYEHDGVPPKIMAAVQAREMADLLACAEQLNTLKEFGDNPNYQFELRVLRVPALHLEGFWVKCLSAQGGDLVLPYGLLLDGQNLVKLGAGARLNRNQPYPMAAYLNLVQEAARLRLAAEDDAPKASTTGA